MGRACGTGGKRSGERSAAGGRKDEVAEESQRGVFTEEARGAPAAADGLPHCGPWHYHKHPLRLLG